MVVVLDVLSILCIMFSWVHVFVLRATTRTVLAIVSKLFSLLYRVMMGPTLLRGKVAWPAQLDAHLALVLQCVLHVQLLGISLVEPNVCLIVVMAELSMVWSSVMTIIRLVEMDVREVVRWRQGMLAMDNHQFVSPSSLGRFVETGRSREVRAVTITMCSMVMDVHLPAVSRQGMLAQEPHQHVHK